MSKEDEQLKEIQVLAIKKYGRPLESLSEEELTDMYRDYLGERGLLEADYTMGEGLIGTEQPEGRTVGDQFFASNPLENLAAVGKVGVGAYMQNKARQGMGDLSKSYQRGSRVAGDVAAHQQGNMMNMLSSAIRSGQDQAPTVAAQSAVATPQAPQPTTQMTGIPLRRDQPYGPAANASIMIGGGPQMPSGGNVPRNPEEWLAYILRRQQPPYR